MTDNRLRIIFMGTPDFALAALRALHEAGHDIICVYTRPPRPKGRGHQVQKTPVHEFAEANGIAVRTPKTLKNAEEQQEFAALNADIAVVAAYGLILPKAILTAPKYGCLNIHASLLPRWRGASPIQHAILAGDAQTGVTIMQMDEGLDTGAMIAKSSVPITAQTTAPGLHDQLAKAGAELIVEILSNPGSIKSEPQDEAQSTYAPLLKKEDGIIDWNKSAAEIDRQIRALNPWPGVYCEGAKGRLKILEAAPVPIPYPQHVGNLCGEGEKPGKILDKTGIVVCGGRTLLKIARLQPEGKKPMDFTSALNGGYVAGSLS